MSGGIRFSVDTERTLEHLEEDLFASSRSRALPREKGESAERRNAFFLLRCYFLASSLYSSYVIGTLGRRIATRDRCAANAWCTCDRHAVMPFAPYRVTTTGRR